MLGGGGGEPFWIEGKTTPGVWLFLGQLTDPSSLQILDFSGFNFFPSFI